MYWFLNIIRKIIYHINITVNILMFSLEVINDNHYYLYLCTLCIYVGMYIYLFTK